MNQRETIIAAFTGWSRILGGHGDWRKWYAFDAQALNLALVLYFVAAAVSVVALIARIGMPAPHTTISLIAGHALPLLALIFSSSVAKRVLKLDNPVTEFYVPGLYILALMGFIGALTIIVGIPLWGAILAIVGVLLFKLARAVGLAFTPALVYGLFNFIAGLPYSLYMMGGTFAVST